MRSVLSISHSVVKVEMVLLERGEAAVADQRPADDGTPRSIVEHAAGGVPPPHARTVSRNCGKLADGGLVLQAGLLEGAEGRRRQHWPTCTSSSRTSSRRRRCARRRTGSGRSRAAPWLSTCRRFASARQTHFPRPALCVTRRRAYQTRCVSARRRLGARVEASWSSFDLS